MDDDLSIPESSRSSKGKKRGGKSSGPRERRKSAEEKKSDKKPRKRPVKAQPDPALPLSKYTLVITGQLDALRRNDLTDVLKELGAKVTGSVSSRTSFLVVGSVLEDGREVSASTKYRKAQEKGVPIMNEEKLEDWLQKELKNPQFTLGRAKEFLAGKPVAAKSVENTVKTIKARAEVGKGKMWVDKYAPLNSSEITGNTGTIGKLRQWIHDWERVVLEGHKKQIAFRPGMSRDNIENVNARACLLSGPPGIGKSTAAALCSREEGYDPLETNASDNRSKKIIEQLLTDAVENESITKYSSRADARRLNLGRKTIVVMDEVDGVSGNSDRGGIQALIKVIKTTKTPIICICNDRQSTKVRNLASHCYDLRFIRPQNATIKNHMKEILMTEGVQMDDNALEILIESAGNDIRQLINMLQLHTSTQKSTTFMQMKEHLNNVAKDKSIMVSPFEAVTKLLSQRESRDLSVQRKMDLFFIDFELMPLLVQENYLTPYGQSKDLRDITEAAESADYISMGDCISKTLRAQNEWTLLPDVGLCSTVAPTTLSARFPIFARFPGWFGKNSSMRKTKRLIGELSCAMAGKVNMPQDALMNDAVPYLFSQAIKMLNDDKVEEAVAFLNEYRITIELFKENMAELCERTRQRYSFDNVDSKVKAAFTRTYHKLHPDIVVKKKKRDSNSDEFSDKHDPDREPEKEVPKDEEEEKEEIVVQGKSTSKSAAKQKGKPRQKARKEQAKAKTRAKPKKNQKKNANKSRRKKSKSDSLDNFIDDE
eukprot:TRINITY_DN1794_c0_g1_i4.p1 TRINITY_DN1794_c0_g1~~TRINITY_DN1794_c0_g1_i4.p1  ORF type:complete len:769 (-),score=253.97 TRINITY_DN1794_c0_g1_i4:133-2439(-)